MRSMKSASVALKCIAMAASWMISGADSPMTWTPRTRSSIEDAMNFTKPVVLWTAPARGTYASGVVVATAGEWRARTWAPAPPTGARGGSPSASRAGGRCRRPPPRRAAGSYAARRRPRRTHRQASRRLGRAPASPGLAPGPPPPAHPPAPGPAEDVDALGDEDLAEGPPQVGFVAREEPRARDHRHPAAEPAEHLGELDRDVAAAEDDERRGQLGEPAGLVRIEQVAGQVRDRIEARDERDRRAAARGEEDAGAHDVPVAPRGGGGGGGGSGAG